MSKEIQSFTWVRSQTPRSDCNINPQSSNQWQTLNNCRRNSYNETNRWAQDYLKRILRIYYPPFLRVYKPIKCYLNEAAHVSGQWEHEIHTWLHSAMKRQQYCTIARLWRQSKIFNKSLHMNLLTVSRMSLDILLCFPTSPLV